MARLVDDLLDVSRVNRGKVKLRKEQLDLARLMQTTAEDRRAILGKAGLTLQIDVPETPVWVFGDATRLAQVLTNLLDNAAKFSSGRGTVRLRVVADAGLRQAVVTVRDEGFWASSRTCCRGCSSPSCKAIAAWSEPAAAWVWAWPWRRVW